MVSWGQDGPRVNFKGNNLKWMKDVIDFLLSLITHLTALLA
jgi:hypothetical protein